MNLKFQGNEYYDKIFIANYMGNKDITAIIMQYTLGPRNSSTGIIKYLKSL